MPFNFHIPLSKCLFLRVFFNSCLFLFSPDCFSQGKEETDTLPAIELDRIIVKAYEQNRTLREVPAAVSYINRATVDRFGPASFVLAVNTAPGVRMEERSPGSYRFNIRGSSLRSPFGVRNIKVYYNDIPFTNPGGHTYLNQLGTYNFNSIEVIKGPGNSLYGAGTGGVLLIESMNNKKEGGFFAEYTGGSFGLKNSYAGITTASEHGMTQIGFQHQQSNGYRRHSEVNRKVFSLNSHYQLSANKSLQATFLYGDLFYETPGALTLTEYVQDPTAFRPGTAVFPSAERAGAAIRQKTFLAGASYHQQFTRSFSNKTVVYGAYTQLRNPTIRDYGRSNEPHVGGRTTFQLVQPLGAGKLTATTGGEWQQGFTSYSIHKNVSGRADSIRTFDEIGNRQNFYFLQAQFDWKNWAFAASTSINRLQVAFQRFSPQPLSLQKRKFNSEWAPRFSLMRKWNKSILYTSVAKGFSPPTTEELLPSGGAINLGLNAEDGVNFDVGSRGTLFKRTGFDVNAFLFTLKNTIVQRRDASGGSFYLNAGKTRQMGIEAAINQYLFAHSTFIDNSYTWLSYTYHYFRYRDFKQLSNDFSGNRLPGVSPHTISSGFDMSINKTWLGTLTYFYSSRIPLTDANDAYADAYHLLGMKLGFQEVLKEKFNFRIFIGADNLLNQKFSLGNDINGFGGRFYNAAPGRNYYVTLSFQCFKKNETKTDKPDILDNQ